MHDDDRVLSDDEARRLWQRAADLQAEAARRLEERSRALVRGEHTEAGYRLADVRQAAVEAGISPEFVDLALAEGPGGARPGTLDRWADRFLGEGPRALVVTRRFEHPAPHVYGAMQRIFPRFRLTLVDSRGGAPLEGGVLVFELPAVTGTEPTESILRDLLWWADVREVHVRIQPLDEERCEVTLRAPTAYARKLNLAVGGGLVGLMGLFTSLGAAALALPLLVAIGLASAGAELAAMAAAVALGFGTGSGTGVVAWRGLYRWGQRRGEAALHRLLQALAVDLKTGGAFQTPPETPRALPHPPSLPPSS